MSASLAGMLCVTGCSFSGLNSLPLPGTVGRGDSAHIFHVEVSNVGTLESNSPVMLNDVIVGSVGPMSVRNWHADVEVSVRPGVVIPANAVATVGQTSLLGSMHLALDPPVGQQASGVIPPGPIIPLARSSSYPSTEQTLSSLSALVNAGGLGQIGDIIHNFNLALSGREGAVRDLLARLDRFVGVFDDQRQEVVASIQALNRLSGQFAEQREVVSEALHELPPALDVLIRERPNFVTALKSLGEFSDVASAVVNDTQADLVRNLDNLGPTVRAMADVGPDIDSGLAWVTVAPFGQNVIDRGARGDYMNLFVVLDLTRTRLKRDLLNGTRFGNTDLPLVPAPGDPGYETFYARNPLGIPIAPLPADELPAAAPMPPGAEPESIPPVPQGAGG
nr:MCE family protein [Mycolicibacterium pyrenivorans]